MVALILMVITRMMVTDVKVMGMMEVMIMAGMIVMVTDCVQDGSDRDDGDGDRDDDDVMTMTRTMAVVVHDRGMVIEVVMMITGLTVMVLMVTGMIIVVMVREMMMLMVLAVMGDDNSDDGNKADGHGGHSVNEDISGP